MNFSILIRDCMVEVLYCQIPITEQVWLGKNHSMGHQQNRADTHDNPLPSQKKGPQTTRTKHNSEAKEEFQLTQQKTSQVDRGYVKKN